MKVDFKGAIFDLDGTILDSMGLWGEIDEAFLARRSIPMPADYKQALQPMSYAQAADYTIARFGLKEKPAAIMAEWDEMAREAYAHTLALKPFAGEYIRQLKGLGVPVALATASARSLYEPALRRHGLYDCFDALTDLSQVQGDKRGPGLFWLAAEKLGVEIADCMVFEDSLHAAQGAKASGARLTVVQDAYAKPDEAALRGIADRYVAGFGELLGKGVEA
ncbi:MULTISPECIES: HAD family phosphatase [unclassified Clostridium]|uniref:HAD family hydrolase n=1 Tax=unclassified Clostridium TaxID=2614128 RepID=UPI0011070190|nr:MULTISPECIES: HAD family phosphatase [unclassified Clostridium]